MSRRLCASPLQAGREHRHLGHPHDVRRRWRGGEERSRHGGGHPLAEGLEPFGDRSHGIAELLHPGPARSASRSRAAPLRPAAARPRSAARRARRHGRRERGPGPGRERRESTWDLLPHCRTHLPGPRLAPAWPPPAPSRVHRPRPRVLGSPSVEVADKLARLQETDFLRLLPRVTLERLAGESREVALPAGAGSLPRRRRGPRHVRGPGRPGGGAQRARRRSPRGARGTTTARWPSSSPRSAPPRSTRSRPPACSEITEDQFRQHVTRARPRSWP